MSSNLQSKQLFKIMNFIHFITNLNSFEKKLFSGFSFKTKQIFKNNKMIFIFFSPNLKKIMLYKIKQILNLFLYLGFFSCSIQ